MEKATKKLITLNSKLDTSAQNPDVYAERFITKLLQRIFETKDKNSEGWSKKIIIYKLLILITNIYFENTN